MTAVLRARPGSPLPAIVRGALRQAGVEVRNQLLSWVGLSWLLLPGIGLVVVFFLRGSEVMQTEVTLAQVGIPGLIAMYLVSAGLMGVAGQLMSDRDDGTLLRAKAVPHGMSSHVVGNVVVFVVVSLAPIVLLLVAGSLLVDGVSPTTIGGWATLVSVSVLGLFATLPIGAVLGAVAKSPVTLGWTSLLVYGSLAISGVFYPLSALPGWLQWVGQALPTYWVGLGLRSAMLPEAAVALEIGQSWRPAEMVLALGLWAVVGLALAPVALRRMARRQSGSVVAAAQQRVMSRGY